jgi:hypothetical protein
MGEMKDELMWDLEVEIDDALRSAPLASPPPDLYARVMSQVTASAPAPHFHLTLTDIAISCVGSFMVSVFVAYLVFMPAPLRSEALWLVQWIDYLSRISLVWILPCFAAAAVLVGSFVLARSLRGGFDQR